MVQSVHLRVGPVIGRWLPAKIDQDHVLVKIQNMLTVVRAFTEPVNRLMLITGICQPWNNPAQQFYFFTLSVVVVKLNIAKTTEYFC